MGDKPVTMKTKEGGKSSIKCPMLNANYTIWAIRMKNLLKVHKVCSIIETSTEEEHLRFEPLMAYTRKKIDVNKHAEKMGNHRPLLYLPNQVPRKPPEPPDFLKFDGTMFHEWMERCELFFLSIIMIHSLRQHTMHIVSHYYLNNSTALEQWREQGNKLNPLSVRGIFEKLRLRDSKQYPQTLDVSQWKTEHKLCKLVPEDYTTSFHLMLSFEEVEKFFEKVLEKLRSELMYTALLKRYAESGKKDLDRAEAVFKRMRELGLLLKPSPFSYMASLSVENKFKVDEILWANQKVSADEIICVGIGRRRVNRETRFAKLSVVGKDGYRVTMDVHMKVLSERSRVFMEKMSCRREKGVSHMVDIHECDDVEIYVDTVVLMYCDDRKKKLVDENVIKILALLKVSVALSFDDVMVSCLEHLDAAPWSENKEYIVVSCLDELHLLGDSVTLYFQRVSSEPMRARTDDIFLKPFTGVFDVRSFQGS